MFFFQNIIQNTCTLFAWIPHSTGRGGAGGLSVLRAPLLPDQGSTGRPLPGAAPGDGGRDHALSRAAQAAAGHLCSRVRQAGGVGGVFAFLYESAAAIAAAGHHCACEQQAGGVGGGFAFLFGGSFFARIPSDKAPWGLAMPCCQTADPFQPPSLLLPPNFQPIKTANSISNINIIIKPPAMQVFIETVTPSRASS